VSHEHYLLVDHATDRIFVAFGIGMLTIECILFTTLAATARPLRKREVGVARA
jgi:hypothetical protein